ncbi:MAG: hypothetical protein D8M59_12470 [Planctomycetes bacterium]|nr:hypothetical protein [Planctomycetota bacterium]NOG53622.1 hypothetical protein [Planctomycetota bacterium]
MLLFATHSHTAQAQSYTGPDFKPFYGVDIFQMSYSGPETIYKGEVTAINDPSDNSLPLACGWVQMNDANGDTAAFVFDPQMIPYQDENLNIIDRDMGRCILLDTPHNVSSAKAYGLSDRSMSQLVVVGEATVAGQSQAVC